MPDWMTTPWALGGAAVVVLVLLVLVFVLARRRRKPARPRAPRPSERIVGRPATVVQVVRAHGWTGLVRVDDEEWRAESDGPVEIPEGTAVEIVRVVGTHVVVRARED